MRLAPACVSVCAAILAACTGGGADDTADDGDDGDDAPSDYARLIGRTWSVPAGSYDVYKCIRIPVTEEMYVTGFRSDAPVGSHHSVLTVSRADGLTQGEYDCGVATLDLQMIYAAGIGTSDFELPDGVAVRLAPGMFINLNLHLFNAGDAPIDGESAVLVRTIPESAVTAQAEMVFAGTFDIYIPPDGQPHTVRGGCEIGYDASLIALWPHMHQYATHQEVTLTRGGTPTTLHDDAYSFTEQPFYQMATPIELRLGDRVDVACTYVNNGTDPITFGDSSNQEMCFSGLYRYPSNNGILFECVEGSMF
jgi:hypothetical protein